ncbi:MAG: glycosyltransferase family A protein [Candidatus Tantalella remota]|nr:glycosyltransferase family A protein [Candidatus Tantalella remota]
MPSISVIIAVYNDKKYVGECIESILSQTFTDFELILVDDGSTDGTGDILREYASADSRIVLEVKKSNTGIAASRNRGFELSRGTFIAVIDSDDRARPERLREQLEFLSSHGAIGGVGTFQEYIGMYGEHLDIREITQGEGDITDLCTGIVPISHTTCMFRREVLESVGGYRTQFERSVDYDLLLRIQEKYRLFNMGRVLTEHRFSSSRGTVRERKKQMLYMELARQLALERKDKGEDCLQRGDESAYVALKRSIFGTKRIPRFMEISSNYLYWARRMYHRGPIGYARKFVMFSIKHNPLNLKALVYAVFLYAGSGTREYLKGFKKKLF